MISSRTAWWIGAAGLGLLLAWNARSLQRHAPRVQALLARADTRWRLWGDLWLRRWSWWHGLDLRDASYLRGVLDDFSIRCATIARERELGLLDRWDYETLVENERLRCARAARPVLGEELAWEFAEEALERCR